MALFVTSDTHWGHEKMLSFVTTTGERLRPFDSLEEMHETLIENWNKTVHSKDTVYHLGDVAIPKSGLVVMDRLNGRKILMRGNHDRYKLRDYAPYFEDIRGCFYRDGLVFSHIPVHRDTFKGGYVGNVHGHLHCYQVLHEGEPDPRYFNACVERNNFTPVSIDEIRSHFETHFDFKKP